VGEREVMASRSTPIVIAVVLSAKAVMIAFLFGSDFADQLRLAARYTARASFPLFLVSYSASALLRLWPYDATRWIMRTRREWGLGFAVAHTIHLFALGYYNIIILNMPGLQSLLGGGVAYGLMFVMAFTSNRASMIALGAWWKRIHTLGIHWLWFVFTFSYLGRIPDPERWAQGLLFFALCVAALVLRVWAWLRVRQRIAA
jgi:methionine sulfoxide reductase heme-binding subunit